jgi:nicotinate-nucleotide adenylyltransferase
VLVFRTSKAQPARLAILAGSFNPPTRAHLALAAAALAWADEVLLVVPRVFPHKEYVGASLEERLTMLREATQEQERFSVGTSDGGLFIDIAREARAVYPHADLWFVCGRDAAERIVEWDYGHPDAFRKMLDTFGLLVARRQGEYASPPEFAHRIVTLPFESYDADSSTEVRERVSRGESWRELVPAVIADQVERIYS